MNLPLFIAFRYLFAKKSHNVINIISAISAAGMAIGTAALIIILSIYNGFDDLVRTSLGNIEPDILITPSTGKVFVPEDETFDWIYDQEAVLNMSGILQDNVYINYDGRSGIAKAKGVDSVYEEESPLRSHIIEGKFSLHKGQIPLAVVGAGLAYKMEISPRFLSPIQICFPARERSFSMSNPAASIETVNVYNSGIFSVNAEIDDALIIIPIEKMRELLGYKEEVSAIEIRLRKEAGAKELNKLIKEISKRLGPEYKVSDRFRQNESLYKMMRYEKASVYLILIFVIIIIAFNIFGSLSMLIIEKKGDIKILRSMGADEALLRKIFILEGWMISLFGMAAGISAGLAFVFAQRHFGFIKMPGSFMVTSYPVIPQTSDVLITATCVTLIGYLIALLPVSLLRKGLDYTGSPVSLLRKTGIKEK